MSPTSRFANLTGDGAGSTVALIGAGPVGTLLASALLHNGVAFRWVVRSEERRAQLGEGLRLFVGEPLMAPEEGGINAAPTRTGEAGFAPTYELLDFAGEVGAADWYILAVKAQQVLPLISELSPYPGGKVLAVANGLHDGPFHLGLLHGGAYLDPDGALVTGTHNLLYVGPLGQIADVSHELLNLLPAPHLEVEPVRNTTERMWRKAALNCVVNPLSAVLDRINGELRPLLDGALVRGVLDELCAVLYRESDQRIALTPDDLLPELRALIHATAGNSSSMRQDLRAGRETEIEQLNLAVARLGQRHGIDCPLNSALGRLVLALTNNSRS